MVAKHTSRQSIAYSCLNLAKIHMVAKLVIHTEMDIHRLNLAKIHMVAKLGSIVVKVM